MVMTIANIIRLPLLLFTNVENMPILVITPSLSIAETLLPSVSCIQCDWARSLQLCSSEESLQEQSESKQVKCSCGRKSNFEGITCSSDKLGNCRCPCARAKLACHETCRCKSCSNTHGQKPKPSTRRRKAYDNQRQQLRGISGVQFMVSMNEQVLEVCHLLR